MTRLAPLPGLLLASGRLAKLERSLEMLAPDALENTLVLPFAGLAPWVQFLLRPVT